MANDAKTRIEARTGDMTKAKKILFLLIVGLTVCLSSGMITNVKVKGNNSSKQIYRISRESCEAARLAQHPLTLHSSPALSGFFVRRAQKAGALWKSKKLKKSWSPMSRARIEGLAV